MRPVWLCPLRLREPDRPGQRADAGRRTRSSPGTTYVNVGFWGTVAVAPGRPDGDLNRAVEAKVTELGGHKSLYSDAYYDEATFDCLYGTTNLDELQAGARPRRAADRPLREGGETTMSICSSDPTTLDDRGGARGALPARPAVPLHGVRRQRGRPADVAGPAAPARPRAGCPTCSPRPGDLGMARAYVAGDLELRRACTPATPTS